MRGGTNALSIHEGWGYYDVDYLEFRPFAPPTLLPIAPVLTDPLADPHAQFLMDYLTSQYGEKTLAGQQHQASENLPFPGGNYLAKSGGLAPAIRGSDFIDYSPSRRQFGENPRNETEQSIAWAKQTGGIVTMCWHWNAPANLVNQPGQEWWRGFYADATTFDLPAALANPGGNDYQLLLRDVDAIALELRKFEDAGVPVIWRPLHEAQGGWFWWGDHGPEPFKQLWRLMYDRLANHHGLHNLIWEFTSSAAAGDHLQWYPGDDVVDMVGLDIYADATDSMSGQWYDVLDHYNGRKLIALSETGTLPDPDVMEQWGVQWSYFSPWSGSFVDSFSAAALQHTLGHENVVTLDELPATPWSLSAPASADFNADGHFDGADLLAWQRQYLRLGAQTADGNHDGVVDADDLNVWRQRMSGPQQGEPPAAPVPEPATWPAAAVALLAIVRRGANRY